MVSIFFLDWSRTYDARIASQGYKTHSQTIRYSSFMCSYVYQILLTLPFFIFFSFDLFVAMTIASLIDLLLSMCSL